MKWTEISVEQIGKNVFSLLNDWALLTAGTPEKYNTMTISWGSFGVFWNRPILTVGVRPQRYTLGFVEENEYFTVTFPGRAHRAATQYCGVHSGRDVDKVREAGLHPVFGERGVWFEEGELVFVCRKLTRDVLTPDSFLDKAVEEKNYAEKDYHILFSAEIVQVLRRDDE